MGITDGTVTCARCGDWRTSCGLCKGEELLTDHRERLEREKKEECEGERELYLQTKAIRDAKK